MSDNYNEEHDQIYADWLNGKITDEEFAKLEGEEGLRILKDIVAETDDWSLPEVKTNYTTFKQNLNSQQGKQNTMTATKGGKKQENEEDSDSGGKVINMRRMFSVAAAAVITIGFALYYYTKIYNIQRYETVAGQVMELKLPDGTRVTLNGSSTLSYEKRGWEDDREVDVDGQAYFEVDKKGPFKVNIQENEVNVLGTKFDVFSKGHIQVVKCFEGKVGVKFGDKEQEVITPGQEIIFNGIVERGTFEETAPTWAGDYTKFDNSQLIEVLEALTLRYNFDFQYDSTKIDVKQKYTGQFINHDADQALKMVFNPLGIAYTKNGLEVTLDQ